MNALVEIPPGGGVVVLRTSEPSTAVWQVTGARFDENRDAWVLPLTWETCVSVRALFGADLTVGPLLSDWARANRPADAASAAPPERLVPVSSAPEPPEPPYPDLDDSDEPWFPYWQGMPEFLHSDLSPWKSVKVHFASARDMAAFAALVGQEVPGRGPGGSIWYPEADIGRFADRRYRDAREATA